MSNIESRNAAMLKANLEAATEKIDDALAMLVAHMDEQQIRALLEERHKAAFDEWMAHLSKPEPIED